MKISVALKQDEAGANSFLKPLSAIPVVNGISVFRDSPGIPLQKVTYYPPRLRFWYLNHLSKFFSMLWCAGKEYEAIIGIYEIPHGMLAFLVGKIRRKKIFVSIIGNPGYAKLRKGLRKKISHFIYMHSDAVTVTGQKSRQILANAGIPADKIFILPNAIDITLFSRKGIDKTYDLISLGRLSPEKELSVLIQIVEKLVIRFPRLKVGIAGKGPDSPQIAQLITDKSLDHNIELLGYVDDRCEFLNRGKLFVLTSSTEGLPRTVVEAMACGVPCICSNVGDIADIVLHGENGFVVDKYNDTQIFAEHIESLLCDDTLYRSFSARACEKSRTCYSYEAAARVWERLLLQPEGNDHAT